MGGNASRVSLRSFFCTVLPYTRRKLHLSADMASNALFEREDSRVLRVDALPSGESCSFFLGLPRIDATV